MFNKKLFSKSLSKYKSIMSKLTNSIYFMYLQFYIKYTTRACLHWDKSNLLKVRRFNLKPKLPERWRGPPIFVNNNKCTKCWFNLGSRSWSLVCRMCCIVFFVKVRVVYLWFEKDYKISTIIFFCKCCHFLRAEVFTTN